MDTPVLFLDGCEDATIRNCSFSSDGVGHQRAATPAPPSKIAVSTNIGDAAIHSVNSSGGLFIRGNRISSCGNAGIRIWRDEAGHDGSIVTGNSIAQDRLGGRRQRPERQRRQRLPGRQRHRLRQRHLRLRLHRRTRQRRPATRRCAATPASTPARSRSSPSSRSRARSSPTTSSTAPRPASTSPISTPAAISPPAPATSCATSIRQSAVNPDTRPVGIYAEADTVVANNVVENVPGIGIVAGYGPFLRNVVDHRQRASTRVNIGIGVSVVQRPVTRSARSMSAAISSRGATRRTASSGSNGRRSCSDDLARDAASYPHVTVSGQHDRARPPASSPPSRASCRRRSPRTLRIVCVAKRSSTSRCVVVGIGDGQQQGRDHRVRGGHVAVVDLERVAPALVADGAALDALGAALLE